MVRRLLTVTLVALAALSATTVTAHHNDDGHAGYQLVGLDHWELNAKTTTGQGITTQLVVFQSVWAAAYVSAINNWNSALSPIAGFNVYTDVSTGGAVTVNAGTDATVCGNLDNGSPAHGCVYGPTWSPGTPTAQIYMYATAFADGNHRLSDVMHELGHVLYYAGEHYKLTGYGCGGTASIMNHCLTTAIESDDLDDYKSAYRILEAPDATYAQMSGSSSIVHLFEGSYFGGNGRTLHQEQFNWIDRSTGGVTGTYANYSGAPRQVSNADDGNPISDTFNAVPSSGTSGASSAADAQEASRHAIRTTGVHIPGPIAFGSRAQASSSQRIGTTTSRSVFGITQAPRSISSRSY